MDVGDKIPSRNFNNKIIGNNYNNKLPLASKFNKNINFNNNPSHPEY